jgi:hypothetical protein
LVRLTYFSLTASGTGFHEKEMCLDVNFINSKSMSISFSLILFTRREPWAVKVSPDTKVETPTLLLLNHPWSGSCLNSRSPTMGPTLLSCENQKQKAYLSPPLRHFWTLRNAS